MKKLLLSIVVLSAATAAQAQWTEQSTGFTSVSRGVSEIHIVDANTVWCLAYDGTDTTNNIQEFTRTTDGGATWTPGMIEVGDPLQAINNLVAIDANTAFISCINGDDVSVDGGMIFKTTDGGLTWEEKNIGSYNADSFLNVVHFFDANVGVTSGDPIGTGSGEFEVWRTTDGGETWTQTPGTDLPNPAGTVGSANAEYGYNGGNVGVGDSFWFVTNKGSIYRTVNKGVTWTKHTTPVTDFSGTAQGAQIFFSTGTSTSNVLSTANGILIKRTGAVATATYTLYKTSNGGTNWDAGAPYPNAYRSLAYIPGSNVLVGTGDNGSDYTSAYSLDNGTTWTEIDTGIQRTSISFLDGATGWAGGFNEDETTGGIYKYTGPALAIPSVVARQQFSATPNPTNGIMQVSNDNAAITGVVVYDLSGKQVYASKYSALNQVNIDLTSLTTGAYFLKATSETGATQTIKIMKN